MKRTTGTDQYVPGMYSKKGRNAAELAESFIRQWSQEGAKREIVQRLTEIPPTICMSRELGVGTLEIADRLSQKAGFRVVDREIMEHIASNAQLSEKTVAIFDERYPGRIAEFFALAFGEKSFIHSDYLKHLFSVVCTIANLGTTIFVGRGVHLLLPRDRILAIRFIASKDFRIRRLADMLNVNEEEAGSKIDALDAEQRDFFKRVYGLKDVTPAEFDLVINRQHFHEPDWAVEVIQSAFRQKFGL